MQYWQAAGPPDAPPESARPIRPTPRAFAVWNREKYIAEQDAKLRFCALTAGESRRATYFHLLVIGPGMDAEGASVSIHRGPTRVAGEVEPRRLHAVSARHSI